MAPHPCQKAIHRPLYFRKGTSVRSIYQFSQSPHRFSIRKPRSVDLRKIAPQRSSQTLSIKQHTTKPSCRQAQLGLYIQRRQQKEKHPHKWMLVFALPITKYCHAVRRCPVDTCKRKKRARISPDSLCSRYLSSRAVTRQVLSAYMCLTSVFGMGTGGPT